MESCDVIAFQNAIVRTSLIANADVRVTKAPFDDVDRHFFPSNGYLSADENVLYVEAVPIAASELKKEDVDVVRICPRSDENTTRSGSGIRHPDGDTDKDGDGKEADVGEQNSLFGSDRLDNDGGIKKAGPEEEVGDLQTSLIEDMQRLALLSTDDRPSSRNSKLTESFDQRDEMKQQGNSPTDGDRLARGPTGGTAVAYPPKPLNWIGQSCPGAKRSQFAVPEFVHFGNDLFIDSTVVGSLSAEGEDCLFQPSKYRKGPQPVESEDQSLPDEPSLPFPWLSSMEVAEVLGSTECGVNLEDFFLAENNYNVPEQLQKIKYELDPYSPGHQLQNGSVVGELFPSADPGCSPTFLQHINQGYMHQQPSLPGISILRTNNQTNALSHGPILPAINSSNRLFQPGMTDDPTQFCADALNLGCRTGILAEEASPPDSGYGGSDYSQSPHPPPKGSPGRDEDFSLESQENLAEIEAILNFIENEVQTSNGNHPMIAPFTKYTIPLEHPPPGKQPPPRKHPPNPASGCYQLPQVNPQPEPTNPPSKNYHIPLENLQVTQTVGQFHHPSSYSSVASLQPVQSSSIQRTPVSSSVSNTSPAIPPSVRSPENPAESTKRRLKGTNSTAPETQRKDESLIERKQLAKASSVIARLTRDQLVTPDSDQDTDPAPRLKPSHEIRLLHLAIAKNERYITEALICRLDRDKLTNSMINLKNKQGQTPLCLATVTNQWALVRLLVDRGADVNVPIPLGVKQTKSFCSPLHFAAGNGKEWLRTLEQILRAKTIDLKALDSEGCSALHKAVLANGLGLFYGRNCEMIDSRESVRQLVIHGIDINQQDGVHSKTALTYALERGDFDLFYYILDLVPSLGTSLPALLNARTGRRGDTLLHVAVTLKTDPSNQMTLVKHMLSQGASPQMRNWDNRLPWELATHSQIAEILHVPVGVGL